jgi:hypothetical protein
MLDFICEWCGKDVMMKPHLDEEMDYVTLHGPGEPIMIPLCRSCFMTAVQALQFGKEVVGECLEPKTGRRIYVAVENVGRQSELVNALVWPNHLLGERASSARKTSITYRAYPDSSE